ncbi:MAG: TldD/PmbA family protein [Armatimonadetes bacterium]|nr:TldD/PmbA family protein [Armatimonadota bacterium]
MNSRDSRLAVLKAIKQEMKRAQGEIGLANFEKPYFLSYLVREFEIYNTWGNYGTVYYSGPAEKYRNIYAEVRVGSHEFDNTISGGLTLNLREEDSYRYVNGPLDNDPLAIREAIWRLTDMKYKEALSQLFNKKSRMLKEVVSRKSTADFSHEQPHKHVDRPLTLPYKPGEWEGLIRRCTTVFKKYPHLVYSWLQIKAVKEVRYYVNTEGSEIISEDLFYQITAEADSLAPDGMPLDNDWQAYFRRTEEFPGEDEMRAALENMAEDLSRLREAPILAPYSGPALLDPEASGVFFHEAIGHRMEGERFTSDEEGHTFAGKLGQRILPEFISIFDDPSMEEFEGRSVWGSYRFDDEGVPAQKVRLVKDGVLENYLLSRTPAEKFLHSNGHGRHQYYEDPMARMANLIVRGKNGVSQKKLKTALMEEARRQKKPFGLRIHTVSSGETNTARYEFQAFSGTPRMVYKVDARTGEETLVRGVEFIGTPLMSVNKVILSGKDYQAHHAYCGAESGWVPVTTISPSILISEIELQRIKDKHRKPPILAPPGH